MYNSDSILRSPCSSLLALFFLVGFWVKMKFVSCALAGILLSFRYLLLLLLMCLWKRRKRAAFCCFFLFLANAAYFKYKRKTRNEEIRLFSSRRRNEIRTSSAYLPCEHRCIRVSSLENEHCYLFMALFSRATVRLRRKKSRQICFERCLCVQSECSLIYYL